MCINLSYCLVCSLFLLQDTRLCHGASKASRTICICVVLRNLLCLLATLMSLKECSYSLKNECSICLKKEYKNLFERPQALHHGADFSTQDPRAYQYASAPLAGHTTLKPTKLPEISLYHFSEDLMFPSVVLVGTLFLCFVLLRKLNESFTETPTSRGVLDKLARKGCVLPFLESLFSFLGTQLSVHLIARNYSQKNFCDLFRLRRKNLLTDVSKKVRLNSLLKVGGSGADVPEIIILIQLLEGIMKSIDTRFFIKKSDFAARFPSPMH